MHLDNEIIETVHKAGVRLFFQDQIDQVSYDMGNTMQDAAHNIKDSINQGIFL